MTREQSLPARNKAIYDRVKAGEDKVKVALEYGLSPIYINTVIKNTAIREANKQRAIAKARGEC